MKKLLSVFTAIAACAALSACSPTPDSGADAKKQAPEYPKTEIIQIDVGGPIATRLPLPGIRRRLTAAPAGVYTLEYVHYMPGEAHDATLDYTLELNDDNTYTLEVVTGGVSASHYGHWYIHGDGNMTMFYDEPQEALAHNVFVSDSLFGELLPQDKIMLYDAGHVIVLKHGDTIHVNP